MTAMELLKTLVLRAPVVTVVVALILIGAAVSIVHVITTRNYEIDVRWQSGAVRVAPDHPKPVAPTPSASIATAAFNE